MAVYVLDKQGAPLMPCTEKRARLLLDRGRARVHRCVPFVIRLTNRLQADCELQSLTIKIDPGSKITGIALVIETDKSLAVLSLMELMHRGSLIRKKKPTLTIKATGRGSYQRTRVNASGFPRGFLSNKKSHFGFQTGDMVRACVPKGVKAVTDHGRVAVRQTGNFNIQGTNSIVQGINHRHGVVTQEADVYGYIQHPLDSKKSKEDAGTGHVLRDTLSIPALNGWISRAKK